jgi:hypothetical protein
MRPEADSERLPLKCLIITRPPSSWLAPSGRGQVANQVEADLEFLGQTRAASAIIFSRALRSSSATAGEGGQRVHQDMT